MRTGHRHQSSWLIVVGILVTGISLLQAGNYVWTPVGGPEGGYIRQIVVDPKTHNAYLFQPERGPAPPPPVGAPPPGAGPGGRGRGPQGPIVAAWFIVLKQ